MQSDKVELGRQRARVALLHFDLAAHREAYDLDLFVALRYLIMESRVLVLLVVSRTAFSSLLPGDHPLSAIDMAKIELP